jgi:hypothetical protein
MGLPKGQTNNASGRPVGSKNKRTEQWEQLGESITGQQAEQFNDFLNKLWGSRNDEDKMIASELYLKTLEYFKPKQARNTIVGDADAPVQIIISDKL